MPPSYFPLIWESTGDQWWYASPIDFAAANGHYELVRELLHLDSNLLIKLTSLRRIRRLETVWDDDEQFNDVAKCRSEVARQLLLQCETKHGNNNSLIRAGYGGWLLYTAASAGDVDFVKELLERDPLLVFGEGEYGVTDIFYAAARSKNSDVFRILFDFSMCGVSSEEEEGGQMSARHSDFRWEMVNRAVHAAARGGNLEILKDFLKDCSDVLVYRDAQGSTILHTSSGKGQVEVVKYVISSFDIITSKDYQGNTALHVAAYRGCLDVTEVLMAAHPSLASIANNYGNTFLHMAVSGFRTPGFRRVDRQIELVKYIISGKITDIQDVINIRNHDERTALHLAVIGNIQSNVVELLMTVPSINLNIRDIDCMTPLDLLKQGPRSSSSEILIKQLISAGGISNSQDYAARSAIASHLKGQGVGISPGTSFRIPDAEIFLYTGTGNATDCEIRSVGYTTCSSDPSEFDSADTLHNNKKSSSVNYAARKLKSLLQWPRKKEQKDAGSKIEDNDSLNSFNLCRGVENYPIPLRQKYSKLFCLSSNNRTLSQRNNLLPSQSARRKFTAGLRHGVIQPKPQFSGPLQSRSSSYLGSYMSSPASLDNEKHVEIAAPFRSRLSFKHKQASFNKRLMNQYFCFGAQGLNVADPQPNERYKHETSIEV